MENFNIDELLFECEVCGCKAVGAMEDDMGNSGGIGIVAAFCPSCGAPLEPVIAIGGEQVSQ